MTTTFRAAYIVAEFGSNGAGTLLTDEADQHLSDADLIAKARALADEVGAVGEIVIGDWKE